VRRQTGTRERENGQIVRYNVAWGGYIFLSVTCAPSEVDLLLGDPSRARFGWSPKVTFAGLVEMMVDADIALARPEAAIAKLP